MFDNVGMRGNLKNKEARLFLGILVEKHIYPIALSSSMNKLGQGMEGARIKSASGYLTGRRYPLIQKSRSEWSWQLEFISTI